MSSKQRILFWIWLMMLVAYLDRFNIAVAGPNLQQSLHINPTQWGFVLSAFSLGYAIMQAPGGYLADRFGARRLLVVAIAGWSVFTALTGLAWSIGSLVGIRIVFGLCEGIENGAQFKLIGDNFDTNSRSSANALFLTALAVGPAVAAPASSWLIVHEGWRMLFVTFACIGLVVAALIYLFLPAQSGIPQNAAPTAALRPKPDLKAAFRLQSTWLIIAAYLLFNIAFWGLNGWMPTYLAKVRNIDISQLGRATMIPYLCGFVGLIVVGRLGQNPFAERRPLLIGACYLLAGVSLFAAFTANSPAQSIAGLSAAAFFLYGGFGPFWACALDNSAPDLRGWFSGLVNFGGQIGGFIAPIVIGQIVSRTGSYSGGFGFMIAALVLSALSLAILQTRTTEASPAGLTANDNPATAQQRPEP